MDQVAIRELMQADLEAAGLDSAKYFRELWKCMICGFEHSEYKTVIFHINHVHSRAEREREPVPSPRRKPCRGS